MENTQTAPQTASLLDRIEALEAENAALRAKVDALVRRLFGAKSEALDPAQLLLLLGEDPDLGKSPEPVDTESPRCSKPASTPCDKKGSRDRKPRVPDHLPVLEEIIEPEPVKACPDAWRCIGQEISESLDYEPARFFRRRHIRPKYVRRKIGGGPEDALEQMLNAPIIAPLPACLQERCIAAPGLLAQIVVGKYCDHLPLYRQEQITKHATTCGCLATA